jgi:hypothetical protein
MKLMKNEEPREIFGSNRSYMWEMEKIKKSMVSFITTHLCALSFSFSMPVKHGLLKESIICNFLETKY